MCAKSEDNLTRLRISRAYFNLVCMPEGQARIISLAQIGNCEIRMLDIPQVIRAKEPLFAIDLFDHDSQTSIDSRVCHDIAEGAAAFEAFVSR